MKTSEFCDNKFKKNDFKETSGILENTEVQFSDTRMIIHDTRNSKKR